MAPWSIAKAISPSPSLTARTSSEASVSVCSDTALEVKRAPLIGAPFLLPGGLRGYRRPLAVSASRPGRCAPSALAPLGRRGLAASRSKAPGSALALDMIPPVQQQHVRRSIKVLLVVASVGLLASFLMRVIEAPFTVWMITLVLSASASAAGIGIAISRPPGR